MSRRDGAILCERCHEPVHDLSAMTQVQARLLLAEHAGRQLCVRYRYDRHGQLKFRPPPPATATMGLTAATALALAACAGYADPNDVDSPEAAMMCEDVSGYTIPCADDPDATAPGQLQPIEPEVAPDEPAPLEEIDVESVQADDVVPQPDLPDWLAPGAMPEPSGEGCPIPYDGDDYITTGVIVGPAYDDDAEYEELRRQSRRERRRERRRQRQRRRQRR